MRCRENEKTDTQTKWSSVQHVCKALKKLDIPFIGFFLRISSLHFPCKKKLRIDYRGVFHRKPRDSRPGIHRTGYSLELNGMIRFQQFQHIIPGSNPATAKLFINVFINKPKLSINIQLLFFKSNNHSQSILYIWSYCRYTNIDPSSDRYAFSL